MCSCISSKSLMRIYNRYSLFSFPPLYCILFSSILSFVFHFSTSSDYSINFHVFLVNLYPLLLRNFFASHYLYFTLFFNINIPFSPLLSDPTTSSQTLGFHTNATSDPSPTVVSTSIRYSSACLLIYMCFASVLTH